MKFNGAFCLFPQKRQSFEPQGTQTCALAPQIVKFYHNIAVIQSVFVPPHSSKRRMMIFRAVSHKLCAGVQHMVLFYMLLPLQLVMLKVSFAMQRSKMIRRLVNAVQSFRQAINLAPDAWSAMLIRTLLKPESQKFVLDVFLSLASHSSYKIPETFWLFMSRFLNYLDKKDTLQEQFIYAIFLFLWSQCFLMASQKLVLIHLVQKLCEFSCSIL